MAPPSLPPALLRRNPLAWLTVFGPGAVIASLTIGSGELIFSTRAGALFGYRLLWFFLLVLVFKWVLVYATARHLVLTGAHPLQRWMELPGPGGWFPLIFLLLGLLAFPVWVGFHAATVGTLLASLTETAPALRGGAHFIWGMAVLGAVLALVLAGGYGALERTQLGIVVAMLGCVLLSLLMVQPDWSEFFAGFFLPRAVQYPEWALAHQELASRPVWVETITYVGVLGGSGYDYLAYVSYLRDKGWGQAGRGFASAMEMHSMAENPSHSNRRWLRAVLMDSILSFAAVLIFTAVFVACGAIILQPRQQLPSGTDLLTLQSQFVTPIFAGLKHVYFAGAFLAIFGTLYGTIEVAPAVLREFALAFNFRHFSATNLRRASVLWVAVGGYLVLAASFMFAWTAHAKSPPGLIEILTPTNLFTGVLACGLICLLSVWTDRRHLPKALRMHSSLTVLIVAAGGAFVLLGLKGYWDRGGAKPWLILAGTVIFGWLAAAWRQYIVNRKISTEHGPETRKGGTG